MFNRRLPGGSLAWPRASGASANLAAGRNPRRANRRPAYLSRREEGDFQQIRTARRGHCDAQRTDEHASADVRQCAVSHFELERAFLSRQANHARGCFPTEEAIVNVLRTMSYEDPAFLSIRPYKFFDLSLIQELKAESP